MPRTQVTVGSLARGGTDLATVTSDSVNGNYFAWTSGPILMSFFSPIACTVTIRSPIYIDTVLKVPDLPIVLVPGTVKLWSVNDPYPYLNGTNIDFDTSVNCSVAVYKV